MNSINSKTTLGYLIITLLVMIKLAIHFYANGHYGFHRDELLHLSAAHHLAWGYMEFPPLIAWIGWLQSQLLGESVWATRFFPTVAGAAMMVLAALMAKELGGKILASVLAATCVLGAYSYFRNHTLFQPVVFDQLFWTLGFYFLIKYLNTESSKWLWWLALSVGLGLLSKYTMIYWVAGVGVGLLFFKKASVYRKPVFWMTVAFGLLIFLPNLIWQLNNGTPFLQHAEALYTGHFENNWSGRIEFLRGQVFSMNRWSFPIWFGGLGLLLFWKRFRRYRSVGIAYLVIVLLFLYTNGKHYYLFAAYPVLFAAGAAGFAQILPSRFKFVLWIGTLWIGIAGLGGAHFGAPILDIEAYGQAAGLNKDQEGRFVGLTGDFADMFGWEEQVAVIDSVYQSLNTSDRANCIIWAENYGEAGAVEILGKKYGLPSPVCKHGSFWLWGPGDKSGTVAISIGNEADDVYYFYQEVELVKIIKHPYAIDEEHNIPLYLCRQPKVLLKDYWPRWRAHVFD